MPEQARVLQFPGRAPRRKSPGDALATAQDYLAIGLSERRSVDINAIYSDLDVLLALCGLLRERANTSAPELFAEATRIFEWVSAQTRSIGYFDERYFFLGESALLAGTACRVLGDVAETELWLDRAEGAYRHTINPTPSLARVAYVRLSLRFDKGRYQDLLELLPSVALTFEKLEMHSELAKCRLLEAMALKELGRFAESSVRLESLLATPQFYAETGLRGLAMLNLGNIRSEEGDQSSALTAYKSAQPLLEASQRYSNLADLKGMVGETLRRLGQKAAAINAYRESVSDFVHLGMQTRAAYLRVVLSEALLEAGRPREAEWELLAALPTINEQQMVPEGFAAVALLQESIKQRKTDPKALSELRRYLQAN